MSNPNPDQSSLNRAGRPPGTKNKATVAREELAKSVAHAVTASLTSDDIATITPLQVLLMVMRTQLEKGDLAGAVSCAEKAAPFCHGRVGHAVADDPLPADLLPDPAPCPDEQGPERPVH